MLIKRSLTKTLPRESGSSTPERKPSQHCVPRGYSPTTLFIERLAEQANHSPPPHETWRPVGGVKVSPKNWSRDETPSVKLLKLSADVAATKHEKTVRMSVHPPETLDKELRRATHQKGESSIAEKKVITNGATIPQVC